MKRGTIEHCPECGQFVMDWGQDDYETYCELCGTHQAYKCPNCEEIIDYLEVVEN